MAGALQGLTTATGAVGDAWERALPPFGVVDGDVSLMVGQMDDGGLLALLDSVTALGRRVDAMTVAVAAEVAGRSPLGSGEDSLAHRAGFGSPGRLVASSSGGTVGRAAVMVAVGGGTATRRSLAGEVLPAAHPHVAAGLRAGSVSLEAAHLIVTMLDRVPSRLAPDVLDRTERVLTEHATRFPLDLLTTLVKETEGLLNPDGVAPREEVLRQGRSLVLKEDKSGRIVLRGEFDPETGAPIKAALDAIVERAQRVARGNNHPGGPTDRAALTADADRGEDDGGAGGAGAPRDSGDGGGVQSVMGEMRTSAQIRADGLADIARHVLGCEDRMPGLPVVTAVVHMDLVDLQDRLGGRRFATIDGVGSCGQTTFVEAHHATMDWSRGGRTDLRDGVLLCSRCHHRVHRHGWEIRIEASGTLASGSGASGTHAGEARASGKVWFIPPAFVDPDRRPRPGVQRQSLRE